jgi:tRNA pseudouridine38-40 synthase
VRIALGLEYDGTAFSGWQTQSDGRGAQDVLEAALAEIAGSSMSTTCAGRTDAGVHALDQVVHFDADVDRPATAWVRGVNRFLPSAIAVRWMRPVPDTFHARFSALRRSYVYWILNEPVRSPLCHGRVGWVFRPLAIEPMSAAARQLVGRHDFSAFRSAECQAASPVRELAELSVARLGRFIRIRATANAFLHHMVRNIVGALVDVGLERRPPDWVTAVLAARDRALAAPTFPAAGLYLERVEYDRAFDLPAPPALTPAGIDAYPDQDLRTDA